MSQDMPAGPALEQLREVIAILRELGNAGPRNQSFKQWRQVTMTLLQRIWPGDQTRAGRFRRIPFSPPSARADAKTIRECYERGVCEAIAFLEGLVLELESAGGKPAPKFVRPAEAPLREPDTHHDRAPGSPVSSATPAPPAPAEAASAPAPVQAGPIEPSPWSGRAEPPAADPATEPPPDPPAPVRPAAPARPAPARSEGAKGSGRSRQRLKDMLGFGDDAPDSASPAARSGPPARGAVPEPPAAAQPPAPQPVAPPPPPPVVAAQSVAPPSPVAAQPVAPPPPPPVVAAPPVAAVAVPAPAPVVESSATPPAPVLPFPSVTVRDGSSGARAGAGSGSTTPHAAADPGDDGFDLDFDLLEGTESEAGPPPATLREMLDREPSPRPAAPSSAAIAVRSMAAKVEHLGVPPGRRAMVRATLIDLGRQLEAPPMQWAAIRQALAFVMDYPPIARRVIPLLLPYLDEAA